MNQKELCIVIQSFVANESISPSTLRSQGAKGMVSIARKFLADLDLFLFSTSEENRFKNQLDKATNALQQSFPHGGRNWGSARKSLNIFLRNAYYNQFLCKYFGLDKSLTFFEVPMDSIVADQLHIIDEHGVLPKWPGVKYLDQKTNVTYQQYLNKLSSQYKVERVHLDVYLWQRLGRALTILKRNKSSK